MTPLEELQAAHKRLSELRDVMTPGKWEVLQVMGDPSWPVIISDGIGAVVNTVRYETIADADAHLIVTLHRTIDAQLALLQSAITLAECNLTWNGRANQWYRLESSNDHMLLARAINGGSDDAA